MIIPIELRFEADKDSKSAFRTDKTIKSHDVNSVEFHISIEGLELTDDYTAKILSVFHSSKRQVNVDCEIVDGKIIYKPDTNLISRFEHVTSYVYVYKGNQSLDVREFIYTVGLSKIDETSLKVKEVYDQSYADLLADFEQALSDYKDNLPQADSVRADIDAILNQFGVDSQAKLLQYDTDVQRVITDNQTAFDLAETGRQDSYEQAEDNRNQAVADWTQEADALLETVEGNESARVVDETTRKTAEAERIQAEQARKEAETLREESYEQKVDTALVEADIVEKVDNKVTELTPRMNELTAQLAHMGANVKTFGAIGDGVSHPLSERFQYLSQAKEIYPHAYSLNNELDWCAIQAAVNHVIANGGGSVFLPAGRYVTGDTIELDSNIELFGAGMYNTTFFPNYLGANGFSDLIRVAGDAENRKRNVVVRDFGIDGSNLEFYVKVEPEPAFEAGQWARIVPRFVDNFVAHDIFCYHGSHVFQMSGCENFLIDRIRCDYNFNVVHMTGGQNKRGVISNINASRVATVVDFGGGNSDVVVSDIYGNNEGYIRNDQEAFDIGGAKNVQISNAIVENFNFGVTVKGEGAEWDDVRFSNCTFIDFLEYGIRATRGDMTKSGKLSLSDCTFISDKMTLVEGYAIEAIGNNEGSGSFDLTNVKIDVNKGGINSYGFKSFDINNVKIKAGSRGVFFQGHRNVANGSWDLVGLSVESTGAPIDLRNGKGKTILSDFSVVGGSDTTAAIFIRGVSNPILRNGLINNVGNHGIHLYFEPFNIQQPNTVNGLLADLSNIAIRDWGQSAKHRQGVIFTVPSVTGDFKGLRFRNLTFEITGTQRSQIGISWSAFSTNNIDYSMMDGITFYRVPKPESQPQFKGTNNVEKIIEIN